ncbi:MAG: Ig-like domain-containing protein [Rhizomicrobium sp.]
MKRITVFVAAMSILYFAGAGRAADAIFSYDELGRLIQATYPNGTAIHYTYDAAGNRVAVFTSTANGPPVAVIDSIATNENTAKNVDPRINDSDPDGDPLTITTSTDGGHGTVAIVGGTSLTYTPALDYSGPDSFTYTISDGHAHTATASVSVTVMFVNQPPIARDDMVTTNHDTAHTFDPRSNDTDPETDALTITDSTNGGHGTVTINAGMSLTYTPAAHYSGSDSFTYTISDGHGDGHAATASVAVTITNDNVAPVANDDHIQVAFGHRTVTFDPRANDTDSDGDTLTITSTTPPTVGTVTVNPDMSLSFNGGLGFPIDGTGTSQFSYTISDGHLHTATATVFVTSAPCTGPSC